jgi:tryptophan synthase alpha chain
MSRLAATFQQLGKANSKGLVAFITAGDPSPEFTLSLLHDMVKAGVDVIELGVPFSDPMADGPVIQKASERALAGHMSLRKTLALAAEFRKTDTATPVVLMGYLNPVEAMGYSQFAVQAAQAGVDGVLTVDLPPEECEELAGLLTDRQIDPIFLLAPNSTDERIALMAKIGRGYLYYVSLKGVTGAGHLDIGSVEAKLKQIKSITSLPVGVGFGVKDAATAKSIAALGDAVVVGSALISKIEANLDNLEKARSEIISLLSSMRHAMDQ